MNNKIILCITVLFHCLLFIVIGGLLASCNPRPSTVLRDTSCDPPCWYGIIPGKSAKDDVKLLLQKIPDVDPNSIEDTAITTGGIYDHIKWRSDSGDGDFGGVIYFRDGIVASIGIGPKKGAINLEDAIEKFGEPEFTYAYKETGEIDRMVIFLLYPKNGYMLLYNSGQFRSGSDSIEPTHSIEYVDYMDPKLFYELVTSHPFIGISQDLATLQQNMRPWEGYGDILFFEK